MIGNVPLAYGSPSIWLSRLIAAMCALGLAVTAVCAVIPDPVLAQQSAPMEIVRCQDRNVVVRSPRARDADIACEGARDALRFLMAQGFDVDTDIAVDILPKLPSDARPSAVGCYLERKRRVMVLSFSEFEKHKTWFKIPIDVSLYRSLVTHEVAHHVAACNFTIPRPSIQAKEYVAYVTMLATMNPAQRDRVLSRFPGEGFEGEWQMDATIYLADPMRFGVQAYRHFLKQPSGSDYLRAILDGKVLAY